MLRSSSMIRTDAIGVTLRGSSSVKRVPSPRRALQVHPTAVGLHDVAHDREAEAGGADVSPLPGKLRKALEHPFALLGCDAGTGVAHRQRATSPETALATRPAAGGV